MIRSFLDTIYYFILYRIKYREKKRSFGEEHPNLTFYVIGIDYEVEGLFAIVKNVLVHIEYAINKGYVPVVDMQHYRSQFQKKDINIWEYFFEQPMGYGLDEIKNAKKVIYSRNLRQWIGHSIFVSILNEDNHGKLQSLKKIYNKYIIPSSQTKIYIEDQYNKIIGEKKNIMGVLCRGTDYTNRPSGHPIQPDFEMIDKKIESYHGKIDFIFVATEDDTILQQFINKYHKRILCVNQFRFKNLQSNYICESGLGEDGLIKLNLDYLSSIYILSRCDYFVGGRTAGTIGVALMATSQMKDFYAFNIGFYE